MTRRTLSVVLGLALALAAILYFVTGPSRARKDVAVSKATAVTAEGAKAAAQDTIEIIVERGEDHHRIDLITQGNRDAILSASGASEAVGSGVHNTGLAALCLRDAYRLQPSCQRLLNADPGDAAN